MKMFKNVYKDDMMKKAQHLAVRNTAGWYYFTHQLLEVTGEDVTAFLDRIYVNPIFNLKVGSARYTTMLNNDGIINDDVVIFRLEENKYWISTLYVNKLIKWFDIQKGVNKVEYKDVTNTWCMYSIQGPKSKDILNSFLSESVDDQKFFTIRDNTIDDIPVKVSRAGFAGEKFGYEIYVAPENAEFVASKLTECEKAYEAMQVTEFQVMVWTLPTERGFYLMCDLNGTNPLEVGFERGIDWSKNFIGKEALEKVKDRGSARQMLGFTVEDDDVHIPTKSLGNLGSPVILDGEEIGRVRKFTYSYLLNKNIGYVLVDSRKAKIGDKVNINGIEAILTDKVFS